MKTIKNTVLLGARALLGALQTGQAAPTIITTAQGRGADLNVRGGAYATGNHATNLLRVRNSANLGDARKMYLRFDLSTLPAPVKNATGAMLGLQMLAPEGHSPPGKVWTFNVSGMKDGLATENWDERAVMWNTAPLSDINSPLNLTGDALPLGTFSLTGAGVAGQKITFSSPALLKFLQSDSNGVVTLIITRQQAGAGGGEDVTHIFAPKEHAPDAPPMLSVAFNGENPVLAGVQPVVKTHPLPTEPVPASDPSAKEINAFWEADKKQMPPQGAVLFMGSSSIRIWGTLAQDFPEIPVINRGFGGSLIEGSTQFAARIAFPYWPKMIVLAAGTNDLAYGNKNPQQVLQEFKDFVAVIHSGLPDTRIIYISINPTVARWNQEADILEANHLIEEFIFQNNSPTQKLNFINSHSQILTPDGQPQPALLQQDGLHFNPQGYKAWKAILKPRILALATMDGVQRLDAPAASMIR